MDNITVGINEEDLGSLSIEILNYADRISEIFDKLDSNMDKLSNSYQGTASKTIIDRYQLLHNNYSKIKDNIISYSDDLIELGHKMNSNDLDLKKLFDNFTIEAQNSIKKI